MEGKSGALATLKTVSRAIHKGSNIHIDNFIFKLHYRYTVIFLLVCIALNSLQQYFGEHIRCIADSGLSTKVLDTYCFFKSTFTVVKHYKESDLEDKVIPHPGIGPFLENEHHVIRHAYYQWVPFVLSLQAAMFYIPHYIWKSFEGARLKAFVIGLQYANLSADGRRIGLKDYAIPSKIEREKEIGKVRKAFIERLHINKPWAFCMIFCEILNFINICLQIFITDVFLGGAFWTLGPSLVSSDMSKLINPLEVIFPKVTKCTFHKYGPSGSLQNHDALCVMALNVVNEKLYSFLWFWFVILAMVSFMGLLWRLLTVVFHSRSGVLNAFVFKMTCPQSIDPWDLVTVTDECDYSDWLFLHYLAKNMDGNVFRDFFTGIAKDINDAMTSEGFRYNIDDIQNLNGS
ncbi:innexin inx7-like [Periplaneta americana]|uniref:innexin inx7-like n=1 Tax=Periplaneta americana TaxID=6978 RepID=UPI0037E900FE